MRKKIPLSVLRDIGWRFWDPIGLVENRQNCEDEYDTYLIRAMSMYLKQATVDDIADYLADIEANHIGLEIADHDRALHTAKEIQIAVSKYLKPT